LDDLGIEETTEFKCVLKK